MLFFRKVTGWLTTYKISREVFPNGKIASTCPSACFCAFVLFVLGFTNSISTLVFFWFEFSAFGTLALLACSFQPPFAFYRIVAILFHKQLPIHKLNGFGPRNLWS
jgi:hypothetical protein